MKEIPKVKMGSKTKDEFRERRRAIADTFRFLSEDVRWKKFGLTCNDLFNGETLMQAVRNRLRKCGHKVD